MVKQHNYDRFKDYLIEKDQNSLRLNMKDIEKIIRAKLPNSAYKYKAWWSGESHPLSKIYMELGYKGKVELGKSLFLVKINPTKINESEEVEIESVSLEVLELEKLKFENIGRWILEKGKINYVFDKEKDIRDALYTFVVDGKIKYLGKTTNLLSKRFYGYKNPGVSQLTNIKNNELIKKELENGNDVLIYSFNGNQGFSYMGYQINLAAGLEDILIKQFKPMWNKQGK